MSGPRTGPLRTAGCRAFTMRLGPPGDVDILEAASAVTVGTRSVFRGCIVGASALWLRFGENSHIVHIQVAHGETREDTYEALLKMGEALTSRCPEVTFRAH